MVRVCSVGIDTWSPSWWLEPESAAARHLTALATERAARGRLLPEAIASHRIGWHGASGLLYAEGHPNGEGLARPAELPGALDRLELALLDAGVPLPVGRHGVDVYGQQFEGFAGIRRLDSTCDLATESTAEGLAIMAGVAAVARELARTKANIWYGQSGHIETVGLHGYGGGRLLGRFYDKGAESSTAAPGRLLRPEDQRRWGKRERRDVAELTGTYVRQQFVGRFAPLWHAAKGVTVGGPLILAGKLRELVDADELSAAQAETLAGHLVMQAVGLPGQSGSTRRRRRAQLRRHGLVLADGVLQEVEVDLGQVLEACMDSEVWGAGG